MTPNLDRSNIDLFQNIQKTPTYQKPKEIKNKKIYYSDRYIYLDPNEFGIVWHNVLLFIILHGFYFRGLYGVLTMDPEFFKCVPISLFFSLMSGYGVTCGAHRLWSHKSYSAKLPLRVFLMVGHIIAGQNNLYVWCRDHRVHHKFSDTDADPHNTNRGFFFAHMGWLMYKKHPDVLVKGGKVDLSDLNRDPVIRFQRKYYYLLFFVINMFLPIYGSMRLMGASFYASVLYSFLLRYATTLHSTWFVNSAAHMFGEQPYNDRIRPVENLWVSFFSAGEGYHNYHHSFPFDYSTSEFSKFNLAKSFIDFMARRGQAYNLKRASDKLVDQSKMNVAKRKYPKVNDEQDLNDNYVVENAKDAESNNGLNCSNTDKENGKKIKNKRLYKVNEKVDRNNNLLLLNNIINETSLPKER